ncbi:MAG: hypothetical protein WBF99_21010 [Xanthobacteraceae bacterium]
MSSFDTNSSPSGKIPFIEIAKTVISALFIALLVYWIPVFAEQLSPPAEIGLNYASIDNKKGSLLSIRNYSAKAIEELSIFVQADISPESVTADGTLSLEVTSKNGLTVIKLGKIAPRRESYLFIRSDIPFGLNEIKITSTSYVRSTQNLMYLERTYWDFGTLINSLFVFLIYLLAMIFASSRQAKLDVRINELRSELREHQSNSSASAKALEARMRYLKEKLQKVHRQQARARLYLQRRIDQLSAELMFWRRAFTDIHRQIFTSDSKQAEAAMMVILKRSGIPMLKNNTEYSDIEILNMLELDSEDDRRNEESNESSD